MEYLPDYETLSHWLLNYGSFALFVLLALGIIALPVPEETLLVFTGAAMVNGQLPILPTLIAAYTGSICGITVSYIIGRTAGYYFLHRYGSWVGITEKKIQNAHNWFERYGKWTLLFGYFIPGVRHFTGISAGTTELEFRTFSLFAYTGALLWVATFLSIGYFYCESCITFFRTFEIDVDQLIILLCALLFIYAIYKFRGKSVPK